MRAAASLYLPLAFLALGGCSAIHLHGPGPLFPPDSDASQYEADRRHSSTGRLRISEDRLFRRAESVAASLGWTKVEQLGSTMVYSVPVGELYDRVRITFEADRISAILRTESAFDSPRHIQVFITEVSKGIGRVHTLRRASR